MENKASYQGGRDLFLKQQAVYAGRFILLTYGTLAHNIRIRTSATEKVLQVDGVLLWMYILTEISVSVKVERRTRGHGVTLSKKQCRLDIRKFSFS